MTTIVKCSPRIWNPLGGILVTHVGKQAMMSERNKSHPWRHFNLRELEFKRNLENIVTTSLMCQRPEMKSETLGELASAIVFLQVFVI